jgi:hypothetical protein
MPRYIPLPFGPTIDLDAPFFVGGSIAVYANGTGTAAFDHLRGTEYPDPALALGPVVPRLGSSNVAWNANLPTGTALAVATTLDGGATWNAATSGSGIPGLIGQPAPTIDIWTANSGALYTSTNLSGGSISTWAFDTANSRITATGGSSGLYLYNAISTSDIDILCDMDESDGGGLVWRFINQNNAYYLLIGDNQANSATPNTMKIFRVGPALYSAIILADVPSVYYKLNEASGTAITDNSGNAFTGTYSGTGVTYSQTGAIVGSSDTSVLLDGSSGRILVPNTLNVNGWTTLTVECWLKLTNTATLASFPQIAGNDFPSTSHKGFFWYLAPSSDGHTCYFEIGDGTNFQTLSFGLGGLGSLSAGVWYHLVAVYNGSSVTIYVNGASMGTLSTTATSIGTAANQVTIAQYSGTTGGNIAGTFDELAIYHAALNSTQVSNHYTSGIGGGGNATQQIAATAITFTRGTYKRFRVTMLAGVITATMDGGSTITYTDSAPLNAGNIGLYNASGTSRYYQLRIQPQGAYVSGTPVGDSLTAGYVSTQVTLSTTDPSVTPQLLDLTTSARSPQIATGALITQLHDPKKPFTAFYNTEMAALTKASGDFYWQVDQSSALTFVERHATPAPFCLQSADLLNTPSVQPNNAADLYRNRQTITNCVGVTGTITETKIADGSANSWSMAYPLYSAPVITVSGVSKTVGVQGVDTGKDFYWQANSPTIGQDSGAAKIPSGYVNSFTYVGQFPTQVTTDNLPEQAARALVETRTTGIVEAVEDGLGMLASNALIYANGLLARFGNNNTVEIIATTLRSGLAQGQIIPVFIPEFGINNAQLLIMKVTTDGYLQADGSVLYEYTIDATNGPNLANWSSALGL